MKAIRTLLFWVVWLALPAGAVDDVYINARVYTVSPHMPEAQGFAVSSGKFVAVGTTAGMLRLAGEDTRVHDLQERRVLPGFIDEHIHPDLAMEAFFNLNIDAEQTTFAQFKNRLAHYLEQNPESPWVLGSAIDYLWDDGSPIRMFDMPSQRLAGRIGT